MNHFGVLYIGHSQSHILDSALARDRILYTPTRTTLAHHSTTQVHKCPNNHIKAHIHKMVIRPLTVGFQRFWENLKKPIIWRNTSSSRAQGPFLLRYPFPRCRAPTQHHYLCSFGLISNTALNRCISPIQPIYTTFTITHKTAYFGILAL